MRLSRKGAEVILPQGMDIKEARYLMVQVQQYDGIREIRDNRNIVVTDEAYETFSKDDGSGLQHMIHLSRKQHKR